MAQWIWQLEKFPDFTWDNNVLAPLLSRARLKQGHLLGLMSGLEQREISEVNANNLADEMITSSAIEGIDLSRSSVRASIAHRLQLEDAGIAKQDERYVEGVLDIMLNATEAYKEPLSLARLNSWHAALFPTGQSHLKNITVGALRQHSDMEIVSGPLGKTTTHYIAPPHSQLPSQMQQLITWFNDSLTDNQVDGIIRAAVMHLWFEVLHPYDDGNGRIGRALIELALAQDEQNPVRFYSISSAIKIERKHYYQALQTASKANLDITPWLVWFLKCFQNAIEASEYDIATIALKTKFWQRHRTTVFTERQIKVLNKMLDKGLQGFAGGMSTRKFVAISKASRATAYRELTDLVQKKCLRPLPSKGRNSAYDIIWPE